MSCCCSLAHSWTCQYDRRCSSVGHSDLNTVSHLQSWTFAVRFRSFEMSRENQMDEIWLLVADWSMISALADLQCVWWQRAELFKHRHCLIHTSNLSKQYPGVFKDLCVCVWEWVTAWLCLVCVVTCCLCQHFPGMKCCLCCCCLHASLNRDLLRWANRHQIHSQIFTWMLLVYVVKLAFLTENRIFLKCDKFWKNYSLLYLVST